MAKINSSSGDGDSAPVLSASALSKLSEKINAGVQSSKTEKKKKPKARKEKEKKSTISTPTPTVPKPQQALKVNGAPKPVASNIPVNTKFTKADTSHKHESSRGKKRDRNGSVKDSRRPQSAGAKLVITGTNNTALQPRKNPKKEALLKAILELEGTEADLELVGDVDSNSDEEETVIPEKSRGKSANKQEIEDFMKEIGLGKNEVSIVEDDDVEEEEDDAEASGADNESNEEDRIDAPPKVSTSASKDMGPKSKHLVGIFMVKQKFQH